jgi:superfamily II DNA or RNA helicase
VCTAGHPFYTQRGYVSAIKLNSNDFVMEVYERVFFRRKMIFKAKRVESVSFVKRTSDGEFGQLCSDGFVYNIEVEDNNNYIANGFLVHNCHHLSGAKSYRELYSKCKHMEYCYGFSATVSEFNLTNTREFRVFPYEAQKKIGMTGPAVIWELAKDMNKQIDYYTVHGDFGKISLENNHEYSKLVTEQVKKDEFLSMIVTLLQRYGDKTFFIPIPFLEPGEVLLNRLSLYGIPALQWTGGYSKPAGYETLEKVKEAMESKKFRVLIATSVGGEGIDIGAIQGAILAFGRDFKATSQTTGRAGRRGVGTVFNIFNKENGLLMSQARQRNKTLKTAYGCEETKIKL